MKRKFWQVFMIVCVVVLFTSSSNAESKPYPKLKISWNQISLPDNTFALGLTWSPDSKYIVSADAKLSQLYILNLQNQSVERKFDLPDGMDENSSFSVVWSPNGSYLAIAIWGKVYVIDAQTGAIIQTPVLSPDEDNIVDVRWSRDAASLAILSSRGYIYIFDVRSGKTNHIIDLHEKGASNGGYSFFDWSPDNTLFAAHYYGTYVIGIWDINGNLISDGSQEKEEQPSKAPCTSGLESGFGYIHNIQWSKDGKKILISGTNLTVCDFENGSLFLDNAVSYTIHDVIENPLSIFPAVWSPDANWLAGSLSPTSNLCEIQIFDVLHDYQINRIDYWPQACRDIAWSPDGKSIAVQGNNVLWIGSVNPH